MKAIYDFHEIYTLISEKVKFAKSQMAKDELEYKSLMVEEIKKCQDWIDNRSWIWRFTHTRTANEAKLRYLMNTFHWDEPVLRGYSPNTRLKHLVEYEYYDQHFAEVLSKLENRITRQPDDCKQIILNDEEAKAISWWR